nr:hypothetical protein GCM10020185_57620 [Pseudomonas brassicacearum subsp. brassicacearum]
MIDLWSWLGLGEYLIARMNEYTLLATGLMLCAYSSALIIMSGIGIRIMDLVVLTMVSKWGWSFTKAKMIIEIGIFSSGWLLGGPFGVGTIAFLLVIGPLIQPFMNMNAKRFFTQEPWIDSRFIRLLIPIKMIAIHGDGIVSPRLFFNR